ncbi:MAG: ATP-binding cassette domain-containing protein [Patescibacteria group bacterium]|nr:ATP-binding cassette domain-containing protein [Patescibacteria group bacterium]
MTKKFGDLVAVNNISFEIQEKEIFGLLGPNGAGKTTIINMLSCYLEPTSGEAWIADKSIIKEPQEVKKIIGLVPQEIALYPNLTAIEHLKFFGRIHNIPSKKLEEKCKELLNLVRLYERRNDLVKIYSGGMKRRLNIACGLLNDPKFLMMDEPTLGVDPQSRELIFENIFKIRERGVAILYTTHYLEEAERLCDRINIIDEGKSLALGSLDELLTRLEAKIEIKPTKAGRLEQLFIQLTGKRLRD